MIVFRYLLPSVFSFLISQDVELSERSGSLNRIDDGGIIKGISHALDELYDSFVLGTYKADVCAKALAARSTHDDVRKIREPLHFPGT